MDYEQRLSALTPDVVKDLALASERFEPAEKRLCLGMAGVRRGIAKHSTGDWLVCRAPQDPGCARLLDVAASLRETQDLPCLAILEPPIGKDRKQEAKPDFLRAYQGIAWHGLHIALVLDDGERAFLPKNALPSTNVRDSFCGLADEIESALKDDASTAANGAKWIIPEDSREAESLVRLTMNHVLRPKGYRRHVEKTEALAKTYKGFWRGAEADGVWTCEKHPVKHLALESKLNEDVEAPLCQVVDHLAWTMSGDRPGGVLCVRVLRAGRAATTRSNAMKQLEEKLLVRYLDVVINA